MGQDGIRGVEGWKGWGGVPVGWIGDDDARKEERGVFVLPV